MRPPSRTDVRFGGGLPGIDGRTNPAFIKSAGTHTVIHAYKRIHANVFNQVKAAFSMPTSAMALA